MADMAQDDLGSQPGRRADNKAAALRLREDSPIRAVPAPLEAFLEHVDGRAHAAVRIAPGDDARRLVPHLDRLMLVEIDFPTFGDGRGYSSARLLREAGYTGELRAAGAFGIDQLILLRRCGFDAFAPETSLDEAQAQAAWKRYAHIYQSAVDAPPRPTIAQQRHG